MPSAEPADVAHPATYGVAVPHAEFTRRRRAEPVGWVEEPALWRHSAAGRIQQRGTGFWAVTTHDAVVEASRQPEVFSSGQRGAFLNDPRTPADLELMRQLLVNMDDPQHTRIRRVATSVFTPRAIRSLADGVQTHVRDLVAAVRARESFDVVTDLAAELPLLVLSDLLGLPRADRHLLYGWSNNLVGFDDPEYGGGDLDAYRRTFVEAFQYALAVADERRADPRDDLISLLANAEVDGRRLRDREFCQFWLLLVVAGNETTRHLLSGALHLLLHDPAVAQQFATAPAETAVDEFLRVITPIMQFRRTATRDVHLAGADIRAGDKVVLFYVSANRDERVFAEPQRVDLFRRPNPHLSFGIGPHFCLGSHLARMEAAALLSALRPHLPALRPDGEVVRLESNFVNGMKSMPVRWR
ncbi:cytochrome P450 [Micromonospora sp. R77]|uniref:cytochrome P450 n=1 Tax=Micromonospora sp. R77 TaxID=2925836 RepID=UPI001F6163D4|nr:cytochrome P450 [Micromonospora sp. R77]MCI4066473.1 cytochrome P450 [Micromonospora sp. R77]